MVNSFADEFADEFDSAFDYRITDYEKRLEKLEKINYKMRDGLQIISISIILLSIIFLCLLHCLGNAKVF